MALFSLGSIGQFFKGDPTLVGYWTLQENLIDYAKNQHLTITGNVQIGVKGFRTHNRATRILDTSSYLSGTVSFLPSGNSARTVLIWFKKIGPLAQSSNNGLWGYGSYTTGGYFMLSLATDFWGNINFETGDQRSLDAFPPNFFEIKERLIGVHYPGTTPVDLFFTVDGNFYRRDPNRGANPYSTPSTSTFYVGKWLADNNVGDCLVSEVAVFSRLISLNEISSYYKWATKQKKVFSFSPFFFFPESSFLISGQTISQIKTQNSTTFSLSVSESNKLKTIPSSSSIQFLTTANSKREIPKQLIKDIKTEKINFDIINQP